MVVLPSPGRRRRHMDNLGRLVDVRHVYAAAQGAHGFAKRRERIVRLVERDWDGLSILGELVFVHPTDGRQHWNSQRLLDFARGRETGLQHFHREGATEPQPKPSKQRHQ